MRKNLTLGLCGLLAALALLTTRAALARCLDEDCRPAPRPTATWRPLWTATPPRVVLDVGNESPMSTDMPGAPAGSATPPTNAPAGCEAPPPWASMELAERCAPYWPPPLSAPIPYCRLGYTVQMDLVCWGYVPSDPSWFPTPPPGGWPTMTPTAPPLPASPTAPSGYPPAYP